MSAQILLYLDRWVVVTMSIDAPAAVQPKKDAREGRRSLLPAVICPHCWHKFPPHDVTWIARHEDLRGDPVAGQDELVRFRPTRFNVAGDALDARGLPCNRLACPQCHLHIPRALLETEPLVLSLIGVPSSGKSYYLASMTWQLRNQLPKEYLLSLSDMDPESNQTIRDYETTLFVGADRTQFVGIAKTDMAGDVTYCEVRMSDQPVRLPRPLLFTLRPTKEHPRGTEAELLSQALCFYDNAGEHFQPGADTTLAPGTQHVARSRVLLFLYDPTQDTRFRVHCQPISKDPQLYDWARTQLQSTILTETAVRVRQYANLPPNRRLSQPLVVLVSKSDIWAPLIGEDFTSEPCLAPRVPGGPGVLDVKRIHEVSQKVRTLLLSLTPELVAAAEDCSQTVVYVPVSALGRSPEPQAESSMLLIRSGEITPRWVTVPVLYSIAMWSRDPLVNR